MLQGRFGRMVRRQGVSTLVMLVLSMGRAAAVKHWDPGWPIDAHTTVAVPPGQSYGTYTVLPGVVYTLNVGGPQGGGDWDHWIDGDESTPVEDMAVDLELSITWWATGGTFLNGNVGRDVQWRAPDTPGPVTIGAHVDDTTMVIPPETGSRDDAAEDFETLFNYGGPELTVLVRREGSGAPFQSSAAVAAGGLAGSEHRADVQIQTSPPIAGVTITPSISNGTGAGGVNATITLTSTVTDSDGMVTGTYTSSDRTRPVRIQAGRSEATIDQNWNDDGDPWQADPYLYYDEPSPVTFRPRFDDGVDLIPITGHSMRFEVVRADVWHWNPALNDGEGDYEFITYTNDLGDPNAPLLATLASFAPATVGDDPPGSYTSSITIHWDLDAIVDTAYCHLTDLATFE